MPTRPFLRDLALITAAALIGWWAHGAHSPVSVVEAQRTASDTHPTDANLAFQYGGLGPDGELTLYNSSNRTLYVYPSVGRAGSSHINCLYSIHVDRPGAPLERENCPVGSFFSR